MHEVERSEPQFVAQRALLLQFVSPRSIIDL